MLRIFQLYVSSICIIFAQAEDLFDFRNVSLPRSVRVNDLLRRLTLDELHGQLMNGDKIMRGSAPAIPRLGIRPYQWRSECLHGYAEGGNATSFPQAIALAASFDRALFHKVAFLTGLEARAKYNSYVQANDYEYHHGIHCFSPVVNIMRHSLWGRNQETLGEDPYLTGELSNAFVRGLSNLPADGPLPSLEHHVLLAAASCKHFAVHDGPENHPVSRLSFEANVSGADVWMTYSPAFQSCLNGGAQSVMCAYSGINGTPDCANKWLLTDILRKTWNFTGFVVSDEGALQFLVSQHKTFTTHLQAAFAAFTAGVNLENAVEDAPGVYYSLFSLISAGIIKRSQLEKMVRPLFLTRFRQAEFDPPNLNPYARLNQRDFIQSPLHRHWSLVAGCRSTVLLKNLKNFLPIIGSSPDSLPLMRAVLAGPFSTKMNELVGSYHASRMLDFEVNLEVGLHSVAKNLNTAEFCIGGASCTSTNESAFISALTTGDPQILFLTVGTGCELESEGSDRQSLQLPGSQSKMFDLAQKVSPNLPIVLLVYSAGPVNISWAIDSHQVRSIMWFGFPGQDAGNIAARMLLGRPDFSHYSNLEQAMDSKSFFDLRERSGYWWIPAARLPFTWYRSLANLPDITFYSMTNQTYRFIEYSVCKSPTHARVGKCIQVDFPFGFGLTYNKQPDGGFLFLYRNLNILVPVVSSRVGFTFTVEVINRGLLPCDEVVQVYLDWTTLFNTSAAQNFNQLYKAAFRQLIGFRRVGLFPGSVSLLQFSVSPQQLTVWNFGSSRSSIFCSKHHEGSHCGEPVPAEGVAVISVGGQQPSQNPTVDSNIISASVKVVSE